MARALAGPMPGKASNSLAVTELISSVVSSGDDGTSESHIGRYGLQQSRAHAGYSVQPVQVGEGAVGLPICDDGFGQSGAYPRQASHFSCGSSINVDFLPGREGASLLFGTVPLRGP
jgi:hypothetical protein